MDNLQIEWDRDYGVFHRTGWTLAVDGIVVVEFVSLRRAVWEAVRRVAAAKRRALLAASFTRREADVR